MTMLQGGPAGPNADEVEGAFLQEVASDRAVIFTALGGQQGILRGFDHTLVTGELSIDFDAGEAMAERRDASGNLGSHQGYHLWANETKRITHDPPSASNRSDAVVFAWVDSEGGPIGDSVTEVGPQIVIIKGTSGVTTPHTDTDINDELGPGGWFRWADVLIRDDATELDPADVTLTGLDPYDQVGRVQTFLKTANQTVNNSTTLVEDDHLRFPVRAGQKYLMDFSILASVSGGSSTSDIKFNLGIPGGSFNMGGVGPAAGLPSAAFEGEANFRAITGAVAGVLIYGMTGETLSVKLWAYHEATADGEVVLKWAQNNAVAVNTQLRVGSFLTATRVE